MNIKIKKLSENAIIPSYAKEGDAGLDLTAIEVSEHNNQYIEYRTGLAIEIPPGYVGLIFPRSSISKKDLLLTNSVGVIDSSYRGEICLRFKEVSSRFVYSPGDKIGQLIIIPYPQINFIEVEELSGTSRGVGGFGSTDYPKYPDEITIKLAD